MNAAAKSYDGENKYIRITDIDESSSTYDDKDIVSPDGTLSDNYLVKERDILLARTGASTVCTFWTTRYQLARIFLFPSFYNINTGREQNCQVTIPP